MVPQDLLSFSFTESEIVPHYFSAPDHVWLRALLDEYHHHEGKARRVLTERLLEPLPVRAPPDKQRIACHVLDRIWRFQTSAPVKPRSARSILFEEASRLRDRDRAISSASALLGVEPAALLSSLLADLPPEKVVTPPKQPMSVTELAQRANLALVSGMLRRAIAVSIEARCNIRPVVRQAKLQGLLCTLRERPDHNALNRLEVSGPYALFRRTLIYGRALATLVPFAARCHDMELRAACALGNSGDLRTLVIRDGDPLFPAAEESPHDSKLEERFFHDFARAASDWSIQKEPKAVRADGTLIFPDFELRHRVDHRRRWLLEIAGFWTPSYLTDKLRRLRAANLDHFILCIDEERNCAADDLPHRANVIRYRRRVDPNHVISVIEAHPRKPQLPLVDRRGT